MRSVGLLSMLMLVGLVACGGEEPQERDIIGLQSAGVQGIQTAGTGGGCTMGASRVCACNDGAQGSSVCQVDGTFSVCMCSAAVAGIAAAGTGAAGVGPAGVGAAGVAAAAGMAAQPQAGTETGLPGPVIVPEADLAMCNGVGAPPSAEEQVEVLEIRTSDAVPGGFTAPAQSFYGCFWVELDMPEKHHIIGWEGAVGGDRAIHHQQVSLSPPPFYLPAQGQGGLCGLPSVEYTWTGERPPEWTPSIAGYPIGGPENGGKAHFLWQVHFEGATTYSGGFNVYITKQLRKYDAGNFEQGDVAGILVPANQSATHEAKCTADMTREKLTHPIYVFSSMLHAHLTLNRIRAEHYRDGQLINTFGDEMAAFGFFDQTFQPHSPCIEILPGDEIITTCDYTNPWPYDVTGGERTDQEMCTVFMQYFPRLPIPSSNFCGTIDSTGGFMP